MDRDFLIYTKEEYLDISEQFSKLAQKAYDVYLETNDPNDLDNASHFWDAADYYKRKAKSAEDK